MSCSQISRVEWTHVSFKILRYNLTENKKAIITKSANVYLIPTSENCRSW
jgi:hypothetical protein